MPLDSRPPAVRLNPAVWILVLLLFWADPSSAQNATTCDLSSDAHIGCIVDISGQWTMNLANETRTLTQGSPVPRRASIVPPRVTTGEARLVLVYRSLDVARLTCTSSMPCPSVFTPDGGKPVASKEIGERVLQAAMALWSLSPPRFESLLSRADRIPDTVLALDGDQLDLTPLTSALGGQIDRVVVRPIVPQPGQQLEWIITGWKVPDLTGVRAPGLTRGVYTLGLAGADAEPIRSGVVAVVPARRFREAVTALDGVTRLLDRWRGVVPGVRQDAIRRAALQALADQATP